MIGRRAGRAGADRGQKRNVTPIPNPSVSISEPSASPSPLEICARTTVVSFRNQLAKPVKDELSLLKPSSSSVWVYPKPKARSRFGYSYARLADDDGISIDGSSFSGFASWFLNEKTVIRAELSSGDTDGPGIDTDDDSFSIGVSMRF